MNARRVARIVLTVGFAMALPAVGALASCVLAEPPSVLPDPSNARPLILRTSVDPPASSILETWPANGFFIPVEVPNPVATVNWRMFVDSDAVARNDFTSGHLDPAATTNGGIRKIFTEPQQPALDQCHTIELIVAYTFASGSGPTPDQYGGDSISWFYAPNGSLAACPVYVAPDGGAITDGGAPSPDGADE